MPPAPPAPIHPDLHVAELASHLRLASTRLVRRLRQEAATGLPLSSLSALAVVCARGPLSLGRLAEIEGVSPPTITRIAQRLETDGLIARTVDADDRRIKLLAVTVEGEELLVQSRRRRDAWITERLAGLDERDLRAIERVTTLLEGFVDCSRADDERRGARSERAGGATP